MGLPAAIGTPGSLFNTGKLWIKQTRPAPVVLNGSYPVPAVRTLSWPSQRLDVVTAIVGCARSTPRRAAPAEQGRRLVAAAAGKASTGGSDVPELKAADVQRLMNLCKQLNDKWVASFQRCADVGCMHATLQGTHP